MKIAFDYQIFFWQNYGGISRYFKVLAQELSLLDQQVRIFSGLSRNSYLSELSSNLVKGYNLERYPWKTARFIKQLNHHLMSIKINQWQPDIIHETYYSKRATSSINCARVTTVYDMIHELFPNDFSVNDKTTRNKKATFDRVDQIISISHSTKADLVRLFDIDESKVSVVHLGVDLSFADKFEIVGVNNERPYLLYVGSRQGYKNFDTLLRAVADDSKLKNDFDIVAFGGGQFSSSEQHLIKELKFRNEQVRQVSGADQVLVKLYKQAAAFVYPSLYEGFGLPPLEAMMCNCPVVSSNTSSMPEVIADAGEYFDPNDKSSIGQAITNVVYSPARSMQLVDAGKERARLFAWDKCAHETLEVYKNIIG